MTARVHLNQCAECTKPTSNLSLICDGCAPQYRTAEQEREATRDLRSIEALFMEFCDKAAEILPDPAYFGLALYVHASFEPVPDGYRRRVTFSPAIQRGEHEGGGNGL